MVTITKKLLAVLGFLITFYFSLSLVFALLGGMELLFSFIDLPTWVKIMFALISIFSISYIYNNRKDLKRDLTTVFMKIFF